MYAVIFAFVELLFVADIISATAIKVELLELGNSGTITCDHVENDTMVRVVEWYKIASIDAIENGNPILASWDEDRGTASLPNYHMEDATLSLVIENATLEDECLYKCSVLRGDLFTETNYYTRTVMYAVPRMDPLITFNTDSNRVHCTIEHVKPIVYPVLTFGWIIDSTETYAVLNEDGTYTTSVCYALPQIRSASQFVRCSFSYLHSQLETSLDLRDITTDSLMEIKTTIASLTGKSVTSAGEITTYSMIEHKTTTVSPMCTSMCTSMTAEESTVLFYISLALLVLVSSVMPAIIIVWRKYAKFRIKGHHCVLKCICAEKGEEEMPQPTTAMLVELTA